MIALRLVRIMLHLVVGTWICALIFPFTDAAGRAWRIKRWSVQLLSICQVRVEIERRCKEPAGLQALLVANHVSWLDIFVINSMSPCRFVAKSDIRDWPLIGWLCACSGTVFIARGRLRDVRSTFHDIVVSIQNGERIAFFPEGTTAGQGQLLPFHANLFEAAIDAKAPIQPCALRYVDAQGRLDSTVDFVGDMTFVQSLIAILAGQKITAHLIILPLIDIGDATRRALAQNAREAIADALGYDA
jgi:1-acyl-sn-glycerol-3-phosphate acyltransferase